MSHPPTQLIRPPGNAAGELTPTAEWQRVGEIAGDVVGGVEVRIPAAFARPDDIADEAVASERNLIRIERDIINGVGPRVIDVKLQALGQVLLQADQ